MRTVIRPLVPRMEYGLRLFIKRIPYSFVLIIFSFFAVTQVGAQGVSCYAKLNISINNGIPTKLKVSDLTPRTTPTDLMHLVADIEGRSELQFTCADVGQEIMITLRDTITNDRCMVRLNVEDKGNLLIDCRDTSTFCIDNLPMAREMVNIIGCQSLDDLIFLQPEDISSTIINNSSDTIEVIVRRYKVRTQNGKLDSCESRIYIRDFDLNLITFPQDTSIECDINPSDTSETGGINYTSESLLQCNIAVSSRFLDTTVCLSKTKYIKEWTAMKWPSGEMVKDTQLIVLYDSLAIQAPNTLEVIEKDCISGIVISPFTVSKICGANATMIDDISMFDPQINVVGEGYFQLDDTAFVDPGTYQVVYKLLPNLCLGTVEPDTVSITVDTIVETPVLDCSGIVPLSIALKDGQSIWIKIDSVFKGLPVQSCSSTTMVGRKVNIVCGMDTDQFTENLELCPDELLSGQNPGTIGIEIAAKNEAGILSNTCLVNIDVQEKVRPVITPQITPSIALDNDDMMYTLDTNDIIQSLFDNSGCISSVTMTGSGLGLTTGSGLPFFNEGTFFTFDCSHAGMYDVAIFATDCDNNLDTAFTKLTVSQCDIQTLKGTISSASHDLPMSNISVSMGDNKNAKQIITDQEGKFYLNRDELIEMSTIEISHDDSWAQGLSVIDLKLIQDYILGKADFEPWQIFSADIDDSETVTALDMVFIKKIILGLNNDLSSNKMPWLFKEIGQESFKDKFVLPLDKHISEIKINSTKRGDVTGDALSNSKARSISEITYSASKITDHITHFKIDWNDRKDISALQFSFGVNDGQLGQVYGPQDMIWQTKNEVKILYYSNHMTSGQFNSTIEFDVFHMSAESPTLELNNHFSNLIYNELEAESELKLKKLDSYELGNTLNLVAYPNPTLGKSYISITESIIKTGDISINLYDLQGKSVFEKSWNSTDVSNAFPIEIPELPHFGLYIAQIRINDSSEQLYIMKK